MRAEVLIQRTIFGKSPVWIFAKWNENSGLQKFGEYPTPQETKGQNCKKRYTEEVFPAQRMRSENISHDAFAAIY